MQGINEFIVEIKNAFNDEVELGDTKLWIDTDFDRLRYANRIGKVISKPLSHDTPIEVGDEVLMVQTVVMPHISKFGREDSPFLVDPEKGYYRVEKSLIVMYSKAPEKWIAHLDNVFLTRIEKPQKEHSGILEVTFEKEYEDYSKIAFPSVLLEEQGLKVGSLVLHNNDLHEFYVNGEIYQRTLLDYVFAVKDL